jgi:hypothetical protein
LRISIDLGNESKVIRVIEGQDPRQIAVDFAEENGLQGEAAGVLEAHILSNLQRALGGNG